MAVVRCDNGGRICFRTGGFFIDGTPGGGSQRFQQ